MEKVAQLKPLIKIFEYVNRSPTAAQIHSQIWDVRESHPRRMVTPLVDEYSFVYYSSCLANHLENQRLEDIISTGAHVETDKWGFEFAEVTFGQHGAGYTMDGRTPSFTKPTDWPRFKGSYAKGLKTLRVQHANMVENLIFDKLERLTVFFGVGEKGDTSQPTIRKLTAPKLRSFSIFYHDKVPVLEEIHVGNKIERQVFVDVGRDSTMFRFIQLDALEKARRFPLPSMRMPDQSILDFDFSFLKYYASVHIIGGPNEIISSLDLRGVRELTWWQTHFQSMDPDGYSLNEVTQIVAKDLMYFTFETLLTDCTIPVIITDYNSQIRLFSITARALGLNLNGMIERISKGVNSITVKYLAFPETPNEVARYPPINLKFTKSDFDDDFYRLRNLRIIGFFKVETDLPMSELHAIWRKHEAKHGFRRMIHTD